METVLHQAVEAGRLNVCQKLLTESGKENLINQQGDAGWTPLHVAIWEGRPQIAAHLLRQGADPNIKADKEGLTPLIFAICKGNLSLCKRLLACGARVDLSDDKGMTPLQWAQDLQFFAIENLLREFGA